MASPLWLPLQWTDDELFYGYGHRCVRFGAIKPDMAHRLSRSHYIAYLLLISLLISYLFFFAAAIAAASHATRMPHLPYWYS